jgi:hypothetical protein
MKYSSPDSQRGSSDKKPRATQPTRNSVTPPTFYVASTARKPTAVLKSSSSEFRTTSTPSDHVISPQHAIAGGTTTSTQLPRPYGSTASTVAPGYTAVITHVPDARTGENTIAQGPNVMAANAPQTLPFAYPTSTRNDRHAPQLLPAVPDGSPTLPNILIFGETGTGKSSLINMLAGNEIAGVSSDALGCTFGSQMHEAVINDNPFKLWDTAGLNEGEHGTVPAEQAMQNLQDLVHKLKGGVSLLVYCIRGTRFRDIMQINYDLFCSIICQSNVPVVVVVTGLENESPMESWWHENGAQLNAHGMTFAGHACVTTTKGKQLKSGEYMFEEEYEESEGKTRELIMDHYLRTPWIVDERTWLATITAKLASYYDRQASGGTVPTEHGRNTAPIRRETNGALVLMWKLTGLLMKGINLMVNGPQQLGRPYADSRRM